MREITYLGMKNTDRKREFKEKTFDCRCQSEFLTQMDGVHHANCGPILFLAATNLPSSLDPALLRRFHRTFDIGMPTRQERVRMAVSDLKNLNAGRHAGLLGDLSHGFSGSDVSRAAEEARRAVFKRRVVRKMQGKRDDDGQITEQELREAFGLIKPSVDFRRRETKKDQNQDYE